MSIRYNTDVINRMVLDADVVEGELIEHSTVAILVHLHINEECPQLVNNWYQVAISNDMYDYELSIDDIEFDVRLVYAGFENHDFDIESFITVFLDLRKVSCFWFDRPNIFVKQEMYHVLENFIRTERLETYIASEEIQPGFVIDLTGTTKIIVVRFKDKELDFWIGVIRKFYDRLPTDYLNRIYNYYQNVAFPWLQLSKLTDISQSISHETYLALLLTCQRELHDSIFDLCSVKLAFCDSRQLDSLADHFAGQIDLLIVRSLKKLKKQTKLFKGGLFHIDQYLNDRYTSVDYTTVQYFQYTYQSYFEGIKYQDRTALNDTLTRKIELVDHRDLKIVTEMADVSFDVDCSNSLEMDIVTIIKLLEHRNIKTIVLDTSLQWIESEETNHLLDLSLNEKLIVCKGDNSQNFFENFLLSLNSIEIWPRLRLDLYSPLSNYKIFDGTMFSVITLHETTITSGIVEQLQSCELNSAVLNFLDCHLDGTSNIWDLLSTDKNIAEIEITEGETTWQCIFEFVAKKLTDSKTTEFKFPLYVTIKSPASPIVLFDYLFVLDRDNSKLTLVTKRDKIEVDLYSEQNIIEDDLEPDYDFYN